MTEVRRYRATYTFEGRAWIVQFRDPDISTFGRTLASAKAYARSLLAVYLEVADLAVAGVEIEDEIVLPAAAVEVVQLAAMRDESEALRARVADETRRATAVLRRAGLSTRDVGEILGISGTRVAQIERESAAV
jgi:predicted RNase H-like HicB family nuclease